METATIKTFRELWKSLSIPDRDRLSTALSRKCNVSLTTVPRWGSGYRIPKLQSQEIITAYLRTQGHEVDQKTLFPE